MSAVVKSWAATGGAQDPEGQPCTLPYSQLQDSGSHGAAVPEPSGCMEIYRICGRFRRRLLLLSIMLSAFVLLSLYVLTFGCCVEVVNSGVDQRDYPSSSSSSSSLSSQNHRVVLLNSPDDEDVRFTKDLEQERHYHHHHHLHRNHHHNHQRLSRRPLVQPDQEPSITNNHNIININNNNKNNHEYYYPENTNKQLVNPSDSMERGDYHNLDSPSYQGQGVGEVPPSRHEEYPEDDEDSYGDIVIRGRTSSREGLPDSPGLKYPVSGNMVRTAQAGSRKLPQALIIGVKKGGTRALLEFLRIHPDVRAPGPEPHFFDKNFNRGLQWYRSQMPTTIEGQLTVEKTPSYFITKGVPGRIFNMNKHMKLIVVVRDPVTRAISDYTQTASKRPDVKAFEAMAFLNNSTGIVDTSWGAIRIGVYAKHLERWLKYFPLSQIHFVHGEKLISNPAGEMSKIQEYLGLKNVINEKHFFFNTTKGFPCLKKPEGSGNPHCLGKTKGRTHPKVDDKTLKRLQDFYRPFNAKFYQMTNQNFGWP